MSKTIAPVAKKTIATKTVAKTPAVKAPKVEAKKVAALPVVSAPVPAPVPAPVAHIEDPVLAAAIAAPAMERREKSATLVEYKETFEILREKNFNNHQISEFFNQNGIKTNPVAVRSYIVSVWPESVKHRAVKVAEPVAA